MAAAVCASPATAHHSNAMFDDEQVVTIEGVVTRYEWANPHVYIYVEQATDAEKVEWEIEGQPPAMLRRLGWSPDTIAVGDPVSVSGNPFRDESRKGMYLISLERADSTLYDYASFFAALGTPSEASATPAESLAGTWTTVLAPDVVFPFVQPESLLPLTEAGAAAVASFDESTMNPGKDCVAVPAPFFMLAPDAKSITIEDGVVRIAGEFTAAERVVHIGAAGHDGAEPSVQGHSIGRWEGEALVIDTAAFAPHRTGNADSLPSGPQKHLVERLALSEDKTSLVYHFELSDPEYLAETVVGDVRWDYRPDLTFTAEACDLENARRFIGE
jgi:hypothetical protein